MLCTEICLLGDNAVKWEKAGALGSNCSYLIPGSTMYSLCAPEEATLRLCTSLSHLENRDDKSTYLRGLL